MDRKITHVIILLSLSLTSLLSQNNLTQLSPSQLQEDFKLLRYHLENVHPGLYTYTDKAKMDKLFNGIENDLSVPMSSADFFKRLLSLNQPIGNNHTKINPPADYEDYLKSSTLRFPFRLYFGKDSLYIFTDESTENSIGNGKLLKSINGIPAMDLLNQFADHCPTDGYNRSYPLFVASYRFSRYYAYFHGHPDHFDIEYFDDNDQLKKARIKAITVSEIRQNMKSRITHQALLSDDPYAFKVEDGIGILRVRSFQPTGKGAGRKYKQFIKNSFAQIQNQGLQKLIIDVRNNGGGYPEATWKLLSYLIAKPVQLYTDEFALVDKVQQEEFYQKDFIKHFNRTKKVKRGDVYEIKGSTKLKVKPNKTIYKGQLYILMNERCASATSEFIGLVKSNTDAIFMGIEPGGNPVTQVANDLPILVLPHSKIKATIPLVKWVVNVNWENDGYGVQPEYEMVPTVEELLAKEDRLLSKVITVVKKN